MTSPEDLPVEVYPDTEDGLRLHARHRVMRRVLDEPVVYYDDLDERERDWLTHSLRFVHDRCEIDAGLTVERRAEGLLAVDPEREVTDETFPDGSSTVKHAALLLAEQLCARARGAMTGGDAVPVVTDGQMVHLTGELVATYARRCGWSAVYLEGDGGAAQLAADAVALLHRFGLVARRETGWQPRPAIARFAAAAPNRTAGAQSSLWSDGGLT